MGAEALTDVGFQVRRMSMEPENSIIQGKM